MTDRTTPYGGLSAVFQTTPSEARSRLRSQIQNRFSQRLLRIGPTPEEAHSISARRSAPQKIVQKCGIRLLHATKIIIEIIILTLRDHFLDLIITITQTLGCLNNTFSRRFGVLEMRSKNRIDPRKKIE